MSVIAVADIGHPDMSLDPTIRECPDTTIRVVHHSGTDPETAIFFYIVENPGKEFEQQLDEDHTVVEWELVAGLEPTRVYRIRHPPETKLISPKTSELSGLMRRAITNVRGWTVRLQFPDRDALAALAEYCDTENISFTLQKMFRQDEWDGGEPTGLTEAQREALMTAYENGYFEEPREARLADIADELDLSPTAIGGRIRRGTAKLVETTLFDD
ncbi:helix-turn-helix domain-containing protein [Halococcus salifodinae]|uniref:Bacterio-opsin activator HTH domain-containing protein n=1 Tax=Halococcus salifodinae DSM 8989 TaxID=1227456 RepID=M0MUT7_9EURY|nr:helix-turn-helix domain-containing protein [Halococcus salifodinae]EMA48225.1 bacterio-opsin activator HTH domain-containing protein [Halococcus salifodinae DSM 8989]